MSLLENYKFKRDFSIWKNKIVKMHLTWLKYLQFQQSRSKAALKISVYH